MYLKLTFREISTSGKRVQVVDCSNYIFNIVPAFCSEVRCTGICWANEDVHVHFSVIPPCVSRFEQFSFVDLPVDLQSKVVKLFIYKLLLFCLILLIRVIHTLCWCLF